jgi:hypothetical protein
MRTTSTLSFFVGLAMIASGAAAFAQSAGSPSAPAPNTAGPSVGAPGQAPGFARSRVSPRSARLRLRRARRRTRTKSIHVAECGPLRG